MATPKVVVAAGESPFGSKPIRRNRSLPDSLEDYDRTTPMVFAWKKLGDETEVFLTGTFVKWQDHIPMALNETGSYFTVVAEISEGIHQYKFIVDQDWKFAPDQQRTTDPQGNVNNCVSVVAPSVLDPIPTSPDLDSMAHCRVLEQSSPKRLLKNHLLLSGVHEVSDSTPVAEAKANNTNDLSWLSDEMDRGDTPLRRAVMHNTETARSDRRLLLVMVGLPARGKSFTAQKMCRYLKWLGYVCKVFNLGSIRRKELGGFQDHNFFRSDNKGARQHRDQIAKAALKNIVDYLLLEGSIAILDATNSTNSRRRLISDTIDEACRTKNLNCKLMFVEVICNDPNIIQANVASKLSSDDYVDMAPRQALADFRTRVVHYEEAYETITDKSLSYVKIFDGNRETQTNRITGFLPTRIVFFLMNLQIGPRPIFITRHGESRYNLEDRIGGDAPLTEQGEMYAKRLAAFIREAAKEDGFVPEQDLCVWSSTLQRAVQTASEIPCAQYIQWKAMDEIDAGNVDGLTYAEFQKKYPREYKARSKDKLRYRYPMGESYQDVIRRLEPVIFELERLAMPVVIVSHRGVLRCLYAYFQGIPQAEVPFIDWPLHEVIRLHPGPYQSEEKRYQIDVPLGRDEEGSVSPTASVELNLPAASVKIVQDLNVEAVDTRGGKHYFGQQ